jgi:2-polyprenyl-3-methyl-5-hydroxy-6-metoxy-1,4-benzoquinol methylase
VAKGTSTASDLNDRIDLSGRTLVFSATYNEIGNVGQLLNDIWAIDPGADVLIVDDASPDGTGDLLREIAATEPRLKVIHRPGKLGLGTAHHLAMLFAIRGGYDVLVTMDADHSHDPACIPRLTERLSEADFVIGSRYMEGGSCDYSGYRRFVSVAANSAARLLLRLPLHEFTTSFRAFRVRRLSNVNFSKMHNEGYSFFMESVYRLDQAGLRVAEVPINFRDRFAGDSKIPRFEIFRGIFKLFHLATSKMLRRSMPPPSEPIVDRCVVCGSEYLSEMYPRQSGESQPAIGSSAFRCSSMTHALKPRVAKCLQCGLAQVPVSEHPPGLEDLYADVVDVDYLQNQRAKRSTFARAYSRIRPFLPKPGRMLEVGSYCGFFLEEARRQGWTVTGIEPSRWAAEYSTASTSFDVVHGSFERVAPSLADQQYDAIVSWDVLEHVSDPRGTLEGAFKLLRAGGILAVSTLDIDSGFARLMGRHWPWIMQMHLQYFSAKALTKMFEQAGFQMLRVEPYRHYASLRYIYRKLCALLPAAAGDPLVKIERLVPDWVVPVTLGDIKLYVGRKP